MQLALDAVLICLLAATLFYALRLERALGVLKQDRGALEKLVSTFDAATHQAEQGVERLRGSAESTGQQLSRQIDKAGGLRDDLAFLTERAERAADRIEQGLRAARPAPAAPERNAVAEPVANTEPALDSLHSQAERELIKALRLSRIVADADNEGPR